MTDEELGKFIREYICETGQSLYIAPTKGSLTVAAFTELPDAGTAYLVKTFSSQARCQGFESPYPLNISPETVDLSPDQPSFDSRPRKRKSTSKRRSRSA